VIRGVVVLSTALVAGGCISGTELVTPPVQPPTAITLVFGPDSADRATAVALGWTQGIPHAQVTITSDDSTIGPRLLAGSDSGTLFLDQLAGRYRIDAVRWLSDSERALLPAGDDAVGFLAHTVLITTGAEPRTAVEMVASRRASLVISEWKGDPVQVPFGDTYLYTGYLRLYNNADTTIYLDGVIIGSGLASQFDLPNFPCSLYSPYALDPLGVWANWYHQLPGRGADYPLLPGATAVLATDAIDHRPLYPLGLDLRGADFEFYAGAGDVDNPDVPNAVDVGVRAAPSGHGLLWSSLGKVAFVAGRLDPGALHTEFFGNGLWARIPANALLDVMAMKTTYQGGYPECAWLVHPRFDHHAVQLLGAAFTDDTLAYRRRILPFTINGGAVLQHTARSDWDFIVTPREPFAVP
jgi:hypothetical protein